MRGCRPVAPPNFRFELRKDKLRVKSGGGKDGTSLRSNLSGGNEPEKLWQFYIQLTQVECGLQRLKDDLAASDLSSVEERIDGARSLYHSWLIVCTRTCAPV